ncbi:hypothetical protein N7491_005720 [Penicillium cf. griseofulvum]|uniref:Uncharacterized protein n=1 Tax=Penicillium cf. griseofulvum TaxID=2972120 RepID=A0A9W9J483_9EURO|nr:hypothetical protein N7472_008401 [Penicillium cf. griseofulvum]KAJ5435125.1 hypothetical protein N7491_005720 [Penicillium cf. griseofulvum]
MDTQVYQIIFRPVKTSENRVKDPAAISSAHPTNMGGGNVRVLIGRHRRDRWMQVPSSSAG